jgi:cell division protein FtsQ
LRARAAGGGELMLLQRKRNNRRGASRSPRHYLPSLNWRGLGLSLAALALSAMALAALLWLMDQPIQRVIVTGRLQRVSALDVEKIVRSRLHGAGLVTVDLEDISGGLRTLPWVDSATVQRSWPRALRIEIIEQSAVARWNDAGLLNARGQLFMSEAHFAPPELPQLSGQVGSEAEATARYLAIQGRLTEAGLRLIALTLDARGALSLRLDNGVELRLGRLQIDARFERFMSVAAKLVSERATDIAYVDMRYSNGFAVGWKGGGAHVARGAGASALALAAVHIDG